MINMLARMYKDQRGHPRVTTRESYSHLNKLPTDWAAWMGEWYEVATAEPVSKDLLPTKGDSR